MMNKYAMGLSVAIDLLMNKYVLGLSMTLFLASEACAQTRVFPQVGKEELLLQSTVVDDSETQTFNYNVYVPGNVTNNNQDIGRQTISCSVEPRVTPAAADLSPMTLNEVWLLILGIVIRETTLSIGGRPQTSWASSL